MLLWFGKRLKELQEVERDERGFTLIELLIVVIIIAILAAIALPTFLAQRDKANAAKCKSDTRNAAEAAVLAAAANDANNNSFTGVTVAGTPANISLVGNGFNQSPGITTTIDGTPGADITIRSNCPDPVTDATWTTTGVQGVRGVVSGGEIT
jgi:type IV pilus assembly protein PilA